MKTADVERVSSVLALNFPLPTPTVNWWYVGAYHHSYKLLTGQFEKTNKTIVALKIKKHTLLMAQTVFSLVIPLLVLVIFDKSSRAARRWANEIVDLGASP